MLKNVEIHFADRVPEPTLYEVIEKLALAKPSLKFVHDKDLALHSTGRPMQQPRDYVHDDSKSYAVSFRVIDNGAIAGTINIGHHYSRRSGAPGWRIGVTSHLIRNSRGSRSTVYTSDVAKAVSNAKKYLEAKTMGRVLYEHYEEAYSIARDVVSRLSGPVARGHFLTSAADAQALLHAYMTDTVPHVAGVDTAVRAKLLTPAFEKALSEYYLAKFMGELIMRNQTVFIYRYGAGYAFYSDSIPHSQDEADRAAVTVMEFEQLPIATQEKLGVLQLMQDRELIKDVGLRVNEDTFILM